MIGHIEKIDFIERYIGLLSDADMALELHITIGDVRKIRREFSQKCWTCRNACNGNNCDWVRTHIYPSYVTTAEDGHIVECKRYEYDFR